MKRYNRKAVGAEIKHNEREKNLYTNTFRKNMDLKRKTDGPTDPRDGLIIDDEYLEGAKP